MMRMHPGTQISHGSKSGWGWIWQPRCFCIVRKIQILTDIAISGIDCDDNDAT